MLPYARIIAIVMGAVVCFALLVPIALKRGDTNVAIGVSLVFLVYLAANIVLLRRNPRR